MMVHSMIVQSYFNRGEEKKGPKSWKDREKGVSDAILFTCKSREACSSCSLLTCSCWCFLFLFVFTSGCCTWVNANGMRRDGRGCITTNHPTSHELTLCLSLCLSDWLTDWPWPWSFPNFPVLLSQSRSIPHITQRCWTGKTCVLFLSRKDPNTNTRSGYRSRVFFASS